MARNPLLDWEKIEKLYRLGQLSVREIAKQCETQASSITRRAERDGWTRDQQPIKPAKLTEFQWNQIAERMAAGESINKLAREFNVERSTISRRLSAQTEEVKKVAVKIVESKMALKTLPVSAQITANNLADKLISISEHLAGAANYGAATAHRLAGIANSKVQLVDDARPLDEKSLLELKGIAVLTKLANESSEIGINLLRANKEKVDELNKGPVDTIKRIERVIVRS